MDRWLASALDYIPDWLAFQLRMSRQPGCVIAIVQRGKIIFERAFGHADLSTGAALTPRHRFRVASQSKSFTAAALMKLREQGKLKLDDPVGDYVEGLGAQIARATVGQILSHSAGLIRDGDDSGQFGDRRPFPQHDEVMEVLRRPPAIEPNSRFKYSNHGFALLGVVISAVAKEPYAEFVKREIIDAAGLAETVPDMPIPRGTPFARGHTAELPLGRRAVIPGDFATNAIAPAGGFVSTAGDLARFFNQLAPAARGSVLSAASRREMVRRQWRNPNSVMEVYYGLGLMSGTLGGWDWFGHSGGLQGYISRTATLIDQDLTISVLTNAIDGWAGPWVDGTMHILRAFAQSGAPTRKVADWTGRWWTVWGAVDLVAMGSKVMVATPAAWNPLMDANELEITRRDHGRIKVAHGFGSHGEPVRRVRDKRGRVTELWLAAGQLVPEAKMAAEIAKRYKVVGRRMG
jgi:CubicO group peptidase (beta-lactamase class C family)